MSVIVQIFEASWHIFQDSAVYIIFGILIAGLLRVFFNPSLIARHLGKGRFLSVFKSALFGIPIPL